MGIDIERLRTAKADYENEQKAAIEAEENKKQQLLINSLGKVCDYAANLPKLVFAKVKDIDDDKLNDILAEMFKLDNSSDKYVLEFYFEVPVLHYYGEAFFDASSHKCGTILYEATSHYLISINNDIIVKQDHSSDNIAATFKTDKFGLNRESKNKYIFENLVKYTDSRFYKAIDDRHSLACFDYEDTFDDECVWTIFPDKTVEDLSNTILDKLEEFGLKIVEPKIYASEYEEYCQKIKIDIVFKNPLK